MSSTNTSAAISIFLSLQPSVYNKKITGKALSISAILCTGNIHSILLAKGFRVCRHVQQLQNGLAYESEVT